MVASVGPSQRKPRGSERATDAPRVDSRLMNSQIDARHALAAIRSPPSFFTASVTRTIVLAEGRYMVERIPGAEMVELPRLASKQAAPRWLVPRDNRRP